MRATDGVLVWQAQTILNPATTATVPLVVRGLTSQTANLQEWFVAGGPGTVAWVDKSGVLVGTKVTAQASGAKVEVYDTGGSVNSRRMAMGHSSGYLVLQVRNDDRTSCATSCSSRRPIDRLGSSTRCSSVEAQA